MDWVQQSKLLFAAKKPKHFTNFKHCEECAEHDETLLKATIDTIGINELGNPGWDPICFCTAEGKKYYMPSFIRLSLETINREFYLGQFLFHIVGDGENNDLFKSCSKHQREFIAAFIKNMIDLYSELIESNCSMDDILKAYEIWSKT